jgi:type IV pilus assembly protein PilV
MRADRINAMNHAFDIALAAAAPTGTTFHERVLYAWRGNLVSSLGAGATGQVACNGTDCTIIVQWDDTRATAGSSTFSITTQVQI